MKAVCHIVLLLFEIHIGCGMIQSHWHNAETSMCSLFVYLLQHHVKVLLLNLLSELATFIDQLCTKRLLTHIRIRCVMCCVMCCVVYGLY